MSNRRSQFIDSHRSAAKRLATQAPSIDSCGTAPSQTPLQNLDASRLRSGRGKSLGDTWPSRRAFAVDRDHLPLAVVTRAKPSVWLTTLAPAGWSRISCWRLLIRPRDGRASWPAVASGRPGDDHRSVQGRAYVLCSFRSTSTSTFSPDARITRRFLPRSPAFTGDCSASD
jgi:hypothetical protein